LYATSSLAAGATTSVVFSVGPGTTATTTTILVLLKNKPTTGLAVVIYPSGLVALGPNGAFTAASVSNLKLWLTASAITGKVDGDSVSTWYDQSGQGANATASGGSPVYRTNRLNGQPILEFTAASDQKMRANPTIGLPYTAFVVARMRTGAHYRILGSIYPNNQNYLLGWYGGYQDTMYAEGFVQGLSVTAGTSWLQYTGKGTGSLSSFYKNGTLVTSNAGGTAGFNNGVAISGYAPTGSDQLSDFDIAEVLLYSSALSDADRTIVESYLNTKYAIY
jgi:hypothetical protein